MRAKVRLLRHNGVRLGEGSEQPWREGILETESSAITNRPLTRRLVLRDFRSTPGMGVIAALHQPYVTAVDTMRFTCVGLRRCSLTAARSLQCCKSGLSR